MLHYKTICNTLLTVVFRLIVKVVERKHATLVQSESRLKFMCHHSN